MTLTMLGFTFSPSTISLIFTIVASLFLLFGIIWGLGRGLFKSLSRAIWLVIIGVALIWLTPVITEAILGANLSFLKLQVNGVATPSLNEYLIALINSQSGSVEGLNISDPIIFEFLKKFVLLIVNSFLYVVLFWLAKILLWPVWAVITSAIIKKTNKDGEPAKKFRLGGAIVGACIGLFIGGVTIMPLTGVIDVAQKVNMANDSFLTGQVSTTGILDKYLGENADYILKADTGISFGVYKYTGVEYINQALFNKLSTVKIDDTKISLNEEVDGVVKVLNAIGDIRTTDFDALTQDTTDDLIDDCKTVIDYIFELKTINTVGDKMMPFVESYITDSNLIPSIGSTQGDEMIDDAVTDITSQQMKALKTELHAILNIARAVNNADLLLPIVRGNISQSIILEKMDDEFIDDLVDALYTSRIVKNAMPNIVNFGTEFVTVRLSSTPYEKNEELPDELKTSLKNILKNTVKILDYIDLSSFSIESIPGEAFGSLGAVLGEFKQLMTTPTYFGVVDALNIKAQDMFEQDMLRTFIANSLVRLKTLSNFQTEFTLYSTVFDDLMVLKDANFSDIASLDVEKVGKVLDGLEASYVFGPNINNLVIDIFRDAKAQIVNSNTLDVTLKASINLTFDIIEHNIKNLDREAGFWQTELAALQSLLALDFEDTSNLSSTGKALDEARGSSLLSTPQKLASMDEEDSALNVLIVSMFDYAVDSVASGEIALTNIMNKIKANLSKVESYELEFGYLQSLKNSIEDFQHADNQTLNTDAFNNTAISFGATLDSLKDSRLFVTIDTTDPTNSEDIRQDILEYVLTNVEERLNAVNGINSHIDDMLTDIKSNVPDMPMTAGEGETPYENEFIHLISLINGVYGLASYSTLPSNFDALGNTLDALRLGDADTELPASILSANAGYYVVAMFGKTITSSSSLSDIVKDANVRAEIIEAINNNIDKLSPSNIEDYYNQREFEDEQLATFKNILNDLVAIKQKLSDLNTGISGLSNDLAQIDVAKLGGAFDTFQNTFILDWNVTSLIAKYVIKDFKNSVDVYFQSAINDAVTNHSLNDIQKGTLEVEAEEFASNIKKVIQQEWMFINAISKAVAGEYYDTNPDYDKHTKRASLDDTPDYHIDATTEQISFITEVTDGYGYKDESDVERGSLARIKQAMIAEVAALNLFINELTTQEP